MATVIKGMLGAGLSRMQAIGKSGLSDEGLSQDMYVCACAYLSHVHVLYVIHRYFW